MADKTSEIAEEFYKYRMLMITAISTLSIGTIFYHYVEKLRWLDALYMSVITLTTVGYGDFSPKTDAGKIFTMLYILIGIGILATTANAIFRRAADRRLAKHAQKETEHSEITHI